MMSRRSSRSNSEVSGNSNRGAGFRKTNASLRSVVAHPLGLPLAALLNDVPIDDTFHVLRDTNVPKKGAEWKDNPLTDGVDEIYSAAFNAWGGRGEVPLTLSLAENIEAAGIPVESEKVIEGFDADNSHRKAKFDIVIGHSTNQSHEPISVVTLVEVGMNTERWWTKTDQVLTYAEMLVSNNDPPDSNFRMPEPSLIAIIAIDECDQLSPANRKLDTQARFGVFLCWNRDKKIRLALLWRVQTTGVIAASRAFGKLLQATYICAKFRGSIQTEHYECLGPNCCRIGNNTVSRMCSVEDCRTCRMMSTVRWEV
jgi:hypothetical protein